MDEAAKLQAGITFAREVFQPVSSPSAIPTSHRVILKPNFTSVRNRRPHEENWGTGTDPQFYEGILMGLKELGLKKFHFLEANNFHAWNYRGMMDVNDRHGVDLQRARRAATRNFLRKRTEMNVDEGPRARRLHATSPTTPRSMSPTPGCSTSPSGSRTACA